MVLCILKSKFFHQVCRSWKWCFCFFFYEDFSQVVKFQRFRFLCRETFGTHNLGKNLKKKKKQKHHRNTWWKELYFKIHKTLETDIWRPVEERTSWIQADKVQPVRHSPPTAGVQSSRLGPSMWVLWWTKWGLGGFFSGFLPFSPTTNFIPPFLHTHLIHFISFHQPLWWCIRRGRPVPLLLTDL